MESVTGQDLNPFSHSAFFVLIFESFEDFVGSCRYFFSFVLSGERHDRSFD